MLKNYKAISFILVLFTSLFSFGQTIDTTAILDSLPNLESDSVTVSQESLETNKLVLKLDSAILQKIVDTTFTYLHTPHCMGGLSKKCIDCSGLFYKVFEQNGVKLPHSADDISLFNKKKIPLDSLNRFDFVFFTGTYKSPKLVTHMGMYLGEGNFIHVSSRKGVQIISLVGSPYWRAKYIFGKRICNNCYEK